jgi:hypothetical protein
MRRVGRNREKHKRYPKGWAPSASGTIYFRPTNEADRKIVRALTGGPLSLRLGANADEAAETFARMILPARRQQEGAQPGTVGEIVQRAREEYLPRVKNLETRVWRERHLDEIERAWASRRYARNVYDATKAAAGTFLVAMDVQRHVDQNAATRPVAVNRMVQTGKIIFDEARRRWGLTEYNPFAGLDMNDEAPREVLPDDRDHFFKVYRHLDYASRFVLAMGRYYGRRRGEVLRIELAGIDEQGVHTVRGKRARALILEWDDVEVRRPDGTTVTRPGRLRKMVMRAQREREKVIRPTKVWRNGKRRPAPRVVATTLLVNQRGGRVTPTGFNSAFRRGMARAGLVVELGEAMLAGRMVKRTRRAFNPNDTRAKRASTLARGHATEVLAHDEARTTETVYRRGPLVIRVHESARGNSRSVPEEFTKPRNKLR